MLYEDDQDDRAYKVVVNQEEQYSIWFADRESPPGWNEVGKEGSKDECLEYIKEVWTDMRPLSLRRTMEAAAGADVPPEVPPPNEEPAEFGPSDEDDLVHRLAEGDHPVELRLAGDDKLADLKERIRRGYVQVRFTSTRGGTELSVRLESSSAAEDLNRLEGDGEPVRLVGSLTLDGTKIRTIVDVNLKSFSGVGRIETLS